MSVYELIPRGWSSSNWDVRQDGSVFAQIETSSWTDRGQLNVAGRSYQASGKGWAGNAFFLMLDTTLVAQAEKTGIFSRSFLAAYDGKTYQLKPPSWFSGDFVLLDGEMEVGSIRQEGLFTRKATATLPDSLPVPMQMFIVWLAIVQWRSDAAVAV